MAEDTLFHISLWPRGWLPSESDPRIGNVCPLPSSSEAKFYAMLRISKETAAQICFNVSESTSVQTVCLGYAACQAAPAGSEGV